MKRNFVLFTAFALTAFGSSASACCLFPFFPTYSAGYPAFGFAQPMYPAANYYSASYAPSYGYYGGSSMSGGNCGTGCCNTGYSTNYAAFPTTNSCGQCNMGCGQCSSGYATMNGCANGNCAGAGCIGMEIRSRPEPDLEFDRRDRRTFDNEENRDRDLGTDRRDDFDYDRRTPEDPIRSNPMDDDSFGRSDRATDPLDRRDDWSPSGDDRRTTDPLRNDPMRDPMRDPLLNDDLNGGRANPDFNDFNNPTDFRRRPPLDGGAIDSGTIDSGTNPIDEPVDRSVRKPPISAPVGEEAEDSAPSGADRDPSDVLPKADDSDAQTTSLREGRSFVRFAGFSSGRQKSNSSRISSSRSKERAPRWISLPAPPGRIRL